MTEAPPSPAPKAQDPVATVADAWKRAASAEVWAEIDAMRSTIDSLTQQLAQARADLTDEANVAKLAALLEMMENEAEVSIAACSYLDRAKRIRAAFLSQLSQATARAERAEAALKPFADAADRLKPLAPEWFVTANGNYVASVGDLRKAREALRPVTGESA